MAEPFVRFGCNEGSACIRNLDVANFHFVALKQIYEKTKSDETKVLEN